MRVWRIDPDDVLAAMVKSLILNVIDSNAVLKSMDEQLKQTWLEGDVVGLELLLRGKNVLYCLVLFSYEQNNTKWKLKILPRVAKVFLEECVRQNIESIMLNQIGELCYEIGESGCTEEHIILRDLSFSITREAQKQQHINKGNCKKVAIALLGCCGKKRRAKGGILKDLGVIIAKNVWKTRRMDLWK